MTHALFVVAWFLAGLAVGTIYFVSIWWSARRVADGGRVTATIALSLLRLAALGVLLVLASLQGAAPLLAMALGLVLGRFGVMHGLGRGAA